jgi:formamidopyrimidine-DNA glycosylase
MPELPEVQTTVDGLNKTVKGKIILDVSTTYRSAFYSGKDNIKNPVYFKYFKKKVIGQKILKAERRGKNILIHLHPSTSRSTQRVSDSKSSGHNNRYTIIVHMKMTGYFVYNKANQPYIRLTFKLDNGKSLELSDLRKFATVTLVKTSELALLWRQMKLGPEPLEVRFDFKAFNKQLLKKSKSRIKQVLVDPSVIVGIGNIYSDEILWRSGVHPLSSVEKIPPPQKRLMYKAMKEVLKSGIAMGGDSMSDYRNIKGEKGEFQEHHRAYRRTGKPCHKPKCKGIIARTVVATRSAHFCPKHQKLFQ